MSYKRLYTKASRYTVSGSFSSETYQKLEEIQRKIDRSKNWILNEAVDRYYNYIKTQ